MATVKYAVEYEFRSCGNTQEDLVREWCQTNCEGQFEVVNERIPYPSEVNIGGGYYIWKVKFELESDALGFYLTYR